MNLLDAYQKLKVLAPTFLTKEAASILGISVNHAATILARLAKQDSVIHLARGRWAYSNLIDPLLLPSILSYPMLSYISLYSALYYHGIIDQIPDIIFAVSNGKTKIFKTPLATVSIHSISGFLFSGYESYGKTSILMATPEKALFDTLYFMPAKSRLFKKLTEIEISDKFDFNMCKKWLKLVKNKHRRVMIENKLNDIKR